MWTTVLAIALGAAVRVSSSAAVTAADSLDVVASSWLPAGGSGATVFAMT